MTVASKQLGSLVTANAGTYTLYTVPTGRRTIVKEIVVQNLAAAAQRIIMEVTFSGGATFQWVINVGAVNTATESISYPTWIVINAADVLKVIVSSNTASVLVSGAELVI